MTIGRNDPCPCGSGRKYKKCHLAAGTAQEPSSHPSAVSPLHQLDERVVHEILQFISQRFPFELEKALTALDEHPHMSMQFAAPWLAYIEQFEARTAAEWYREERGWSLSRGIAEWLDSQQASWLSAWQVHEIDPGRTLTLLDLLTGEIRTVQEVKGSQDGQEGMVLLARVVDHRGVSVVSGMHPIPMRPADASEIAEEIRRYVRLRHRVPPERLRNIKVSRRLVDAWSNQIDRLMMPPRLVNHDGDAILLTVDRWDLAGDTPVIASRLMTIEGAEESADGSFNIARDDTLIAQLTFVGDTLEAHTLSRERADLVRPLVESACAELLGRHIRSHTDPAAIFREADETPPPPPPEYSDEEKQIIREVKERHYRRWLDESIPALDGKTPREAVRTATGRRRVAQLLEQIEMRERNEEPDARFDATVLRTELNLPKERPRST